MQPTSQSQIEFFGAPLSRDVPAGDHFEASITFTAPSDDLHHIVEFQMSTPLQVHFGEKVWCDFITQSPQSPEMICLQELNRVPQFAKVEPQVNPMLKQLSQGIKQKII